MGKFWDFMLAKDWEEYRRIQLYKKLGKALEDKQALKIQELTEEINSIKLKNK